jgi:sulfate permease, SulP family
MTFASVPHARVRLAALVAEAKPRVIILDCSAIPDFEYTALRTLTAAEERMQEGGISLWLSALNPLALQMVRRSPLGKALGTERMFFNLDEAVQAYETRSRTA